MLRGGGRQFKSAPGDQKGSKMKNVCKTIKISLTGLVLVPIVSSMIVAAMPLIIWDILKRKTNNETR